MFLTSKTIAKAISLLIVSMVLFVQVASTSHSHIDDDHRPDPSVCVVCLAATQDDDGGDLDIPPSLPVPFKLPLRLSLDFAQVSAPVFGLNRDNEPVREPTRLRLAAPRSPPA